MTQRKRKAAKPVRAWRRWMPINSNGSPREVVSGDDSGESFGPAGYLFTSKARAMRAFRGSTLARVEIREVPKRKTRKRKT